MRTNKDRLTYWSGQIKAWKKSGLTQTEFSRQNNLDQQLFSKWKNKLQKITVPEENALVPVAVTKVRNIQDFSPLELIVSDQFKIRIVSNFNEATLKKLISIIGEIS